MPAYEYRTDVLTHGLLGRKEEELDRKAFEERLNALGAEGWSSRNACRTWRCTARRTATS